MRTGRSYIATAVALGFITLTGCAADEAASSQDESGQDDWGDPKKYPELGGAFAALAPFNGTCSWNATGAVMTLNPAIASNASQTIVIGAAAVGGEMLVNNVKVQTLCGAAAPVTKANLKGIVMVPPSAGTPAVVQTDAANQTVVLDFINGYFAQGTASGAGIKINLAGGTNDSLKIRGGTATASGTTAGPESYTAGQITAGTPAVTTTYINTSQVFAPVVADNARDIEAVGVENFGVSLAAGADTFSGQGGAAVGTGALPVAAPFAVHGGDGNDTLTGGTGADTLTGGEGNDTLNGSDGADKLSGSNGDDTLNGGNGDDTIKGEMGNDTVVSTAKDGADVVNCGNVSDDGVTTYVEGAETDTMTYAGRTTAVTVVLGSGATDGDQTAPAENDDIGTSCERLVGGGGNDTLTGDNVKHTISGGAGNDTITGGTAMDVLNGDDGNDTLLGLAEADTLNGGAGNDTLTGGDDADTLNGDAGDDIFDEGSADSGGDVFNGGAGTDLVDYSARTGALTVTMDGAAANDGEGESDDIKADVENCKGGAGADDITGNDAANRLWGGADDDVLNGGLGDDVFDEGAATNGADTFNGGDGVDTVDYSARVAAITVTIGTGTTDDGLASETDDVIGDVENVLGSLTAANTLTGNASDNELVGGAVNDTLVGGAGNDTLDGGSAGTDSLDCGAGEDLSTGFGTLTTVDCEL